MRWFTLDPRWFKPRSQICEFCDPSTCAECLLTSSALQHLKRLVHQHVRRGLKAAPLYERDYNATSASACFQQWKQAITPDPFISLMGFFSHVALCCNGTSTRENTHGKLCDDGSQSQLRGVGWGSVPHYSTARKSARIFHSSLSFFMVCCNSWKATADF